MKKYSFNYLLLSVISLAMTTFVSCSKDIIDEDVEETVADNDSGTATLTKDQGVLVVRARGAEDGVTDSNISYPLNIYVFDENGMCVETQTLESSSGSMRFHLDEGIYTVCAIGGASAEKYNIPSKENATTAYVLSLKEGMTHNDLMYAKTVTVLAAGENNTITLALSRKVLLLQEVEINSVPDDVTAVNVVLAPLYEDLRLDGVYNGTDGLFSVPLSKQGETSTWKNADVYYLLETVPGASVKVQFNSPQGTNSYSYSLAEGLQANYKIRISGTYTGQSGLDITGVISGTEWAGERTINFDFDESGSDVSENDLQVITGEEPPTAGTLYKGCYVYSKDESYPGISKVVLMAPKVVSGLTFDSSDQKSVRSALKSALADMEVEGIGGWRVPVLTEIQETVTNYSSINKVLQSSEYSYDLIVPGISFFYQTDSGDISAYLKSGTPEFGSSTRLRAFSTVIFK
ncbi:MAG: FimB/Mfa2 family fimbrial subunit [Prevotella sp.]